MVCSPAVTPPPRAAPAIGRIAFFDFNSVPASNGVETAITEPISGRVNPAAQQWLVKGTAQVPSGSIARVELEVIDRETNRYLADNLTTWATTANTINTTLQSTGARTANWQLPLTVSGNRKLHAACAHGLLDRDRRQHPGDQEDRDLRAHRPAPEHQRHRPVRQRDQDLCLHRDRHGNRRHRRQLDQHDDPGREQPLPAGRRHRLLDEQLVQDHPGRRGGEEHHLVQGDHRADAKAPGRPRRGPPTQRDNQTWTQRTASGS